MLSCRNSLRWNCTTPSCPTDQSLKNRAEMADVQKCPALTFGDVFAIPCVVIVINAWTASQWPRLVLGQGTRVPVSIPVGYPDIQIPESPNTSYDWWHSSRGLQVGRCCCPSGSSQPSCCEEGLLHSRFGNQTSIRSMMTTRVPYKLVFPHVAWRHGRNVLKITCTVLSKLVLFY